MGESAWKNVLGTLTVAASDEEKSPVRFNSAILERSFVHLLHLCLKELTQDCCDILTENSLIFWIFCILLNGILMQFVFNYNSVAKNTVGLIPQKKNSFFKISIFLLICQLFQ